MEPWTSAELNYMRVHATPLLVVKASEESPHEPAPKMVPQPTLARLRPSRRRSRRDSLSEGTPLPMQTLWAYLHRYHRHRLLPDAQAEVVGGCSTDTLLSYGCPLQAIVAAFDLDERLDERTVARWQRESGAQCRRVHEHLVEAGKVALLQVQADEIRVKAVGGIYWLASAMEVRSRLWLGSLISRHRDGQLIGGLLMRVRRCGPIEKILLVSDGW